HAVDRSGRYQEHPPLAGDSLQRLLAALGEAEPGAGDKITHRACGEDLAWPGEVLHARPDDHGDSPELAGDDLALACVHPGADLDAEPAHGVADRERTAKRADRPIEGGVEPVACGVLLYAAMSRKLRAHQRMMSLEKVAPTAIADGCGLLRSPDDIGEEHGG